MKSLICPECGAKNDINATFCKVCGSYLKKSALEEEYRKMEYETKKIVDERVEQKIYSEIIDMKRAFAEEKKRFEREIKKMLENGKNEIKDLKSSFIKETAPLIKNLELLEINEKKIENIDRVGNKVNRMHDTVKGLERDVSIIKHFIDDEIKSISYSLKDSVENYIDQMINEVKNVFELRFDSLSKKIETIESYRKKIEHIDAVYKKISKNEKDLNDLRSEISQIKRDFDGKIKRVGKTSTENAEAIANDLKNLKERVKPIDILSEKVEDLEEQKTKADLLGNKINENKENLNKLAEEIPRMKQEFNKQIGDIGIYLREAIEKDTADMVNKLKQEFGLKFNSMSRMLKRAVIQQKKLKDIDFIKSKFDENEKRFNRISGKISDFKANVEGMERKLARWEQNINAITEDFEVLKKKGKSMDYLRNKVRQIEKDNTLAKSMFEKNENELSDLASEVALLKRAKNNLEKLIESNIEKASENIKEELRPKFASLSKQISKVKIDEDKIDNIDSLEKRVEENNGKTNELTRLMNQMFEMVKNTPSEKAFHDSFSELKQEIFKLNEKMEEMRNKIKKMQKNTNIDYMRIEAEVKNTENSTKKLDKRINLILKNIEKIRTSPMKEVRKKYKELERKIDKLEGSKSVPKRHKTKRQLKIEEIKDKIVGEIKNLPKKVEKTEKPEERLNSDETKKEIKGKPESGEAKKEQTLTCRYCHKHFNNERLLELHEMVCEKRPQI